MEMEGPDSWVYVNQYWLAGIGVEKVLKLHFIESVITEGW